MGRTVNVELVIDRPGHKDLIYGTEQVWDHKGDVKPVPEDVWPRMRIHADVYRLVSEPVVTLASSRAAVRPASPPERPVVVPIVPGTKLSEPGDGSDSVLVVLDAQTPGDAAAASPAAEPGTDSAAANEPVHAPVPQDPAAEAMGGYTAERLAKMTDEEIHAVAKQLNYRLHPRVKSPRLHKDFLEAAKAVAAAGVAAPGQRKQAQAKSK